MVTQKMGEIRIFETTEPVIWYCEDLLEMRTLRKGHFTSRKCECNIVHNEIYNID